MDEKKTARQAVAEENGESLDYSKYVAVSPKFAVLNKLITRDPNDYRSAPYFYKYTKEQIAEFLRNPYVNEKNLRDAVQYLYIISPHFRRLIQYFAGLTDFAYVVSPYRIDPKAANKRISNINYRKVLDLMCIMNVRTQLAKILTVCLREDVFYGTIWRTKDCITIQQLPSEYCRISSMEGNVFNVAFNFRYFDTYPQYLANYPQEFKRKYELYKDDTIHPYIELDAPASFAIKATADIVGYIVPPFIGILREIYDIEDYKELKLAKEQIENYALLAMKLPMDEEGNWILDKTKAEDFWRNLDAVMPAEIGSVLTPMDIQKISFERSGSNDSDTVAEAEQNLFTAAGVSSLLFNNSKASANALLLSIKADQNLTFGIVKSIEDMVNRYIQSFNYGKYFKVTFLDVSTFNRKEMGDAYLKAASYGLPTISMYSASQGLGQAELDCMSYLETEIMGLQDMFRPVVSSSQLNKDALDQVGATDEGGAPQKDIGELTDSGEQSSEDKDDWG